MPLIELTHTKYMHKSPGLLTKAVRGLDQVLECNRGGWQAGAGNHHAVVKDLEDDLASGVLVLAVRERVGQRFTQCFDRAFVEVDAIEVDNAHGVSGVAGDEGSSIRPLVRMRSEHLMFTDLRNGPMKMFALPQHQG